MHSGPGDQDAGPNVLFPAGCLGIFPGSTGATAEFNRGVVWSTVWFKKIPVAAMWARGGETSCRETGGVCAVSSWDRAGPELAITVGMDRRR